MSSLDLPSLAAGATDTGPHRERNEDRFGIFPDLGLFVVTDGMSGAVGSGEIVAEIAIDAMRDHFGATRDVASQGLPSGGASHGADRLAQAVRFANSRVIERVAADRRLSGGACTLAALSLAEEGVHVTHVGNSRVYRITGDGIEQLTEDHNLLNDASRLGVSLTPEQRSQIAPSILTRAVGLEGEVLFEVRTFPFHPGDVYLICSDGLHDFVPQDEILAAIRASPDLDLVARDLLGRAIHRGATDNIACVLVVPKPR